MKESKPVLDAKQRSELASRLLGTQKNIYHLSKQLFGIEIDEATWALMDQECKIFKCEICDFFKLSKERDRHVPDYCVDCFRKHT